jgi:hypothetical protein
MHGGGGMAGRGMGGGCMRAPWAAVRTSAA